MKHVLFAGLAGLILAAPVAIAQNAPAPQWQGMQKVHWERFDQAYLAPGVNFRSYTRVMIDPADAAFRKDWQRDYNKVHFDLERRITDEDAQKILEEARSGLGDAFARIFREAGYQVVTAPGPDVLRVKASLADLDVHAPEVLRSAQTKTFAEEAGSARLVLEVRDSVRGALLAGGTDKRDIGDLSFLERRSSISNRADFSRAFRRWAQFSVDALGKLGARPAGSAGG